MSARPDLRAVEGDPDLDAARQANDVDVDGITTDARAFVRARLRLPDYDHTIQRGRGAGARYELALEDGTTIPVGSAADLLEPRKVSAALLANRGVVALHHTPAKFRPVAVALMVHLVVDDLGDPDQDLIGWLSHYIGERGATVDLTDPDQRTDVVSNRVGSFRDRSDGTHYVRPARLHEFIRGALRIQMTLDDLRAQLRRLGFVPTEIYEPRQGNTKTPRKASYWRAPAGYDPGDGR